MCLGMGSKYLTCPNFEVIEEIRCARLEKNCHHRRQSGRDFWGNQFRQVKTEETGSLQRLRRLSCDTAHSCADGVNQLKISLLPYQAFQWSRIISSTPSGCTFRRHKDTFWRVGSGDRGVPVEAKRGTHGSERLSFFWIWRLCQKPPPRPLLTSLRGCGANYNSLRMILPSSARKRSTS